MAFLAFTGPWVVVVFSERLTGYPLFAALLRELLPVAHISVCGGPSVGAWWTAGCGGSISDFKVLIVLEKLSRG